LRKPEPFGCNSKHRRDSAAYGSASRGSIKRLVAASTTPVPPAPLIAN
jgi:hypothetical protein